MAPTNHSKRLSCVNCRQRKIKCNRLDPCNHCTKAGITCAFPTPLRVRGGLKARNAEITKRLSRLEGLLAGRPGEDDGQPTTAAPVSSILEARQPPPSAVVELPSLIPAPPPGTQELEPILKPDGSRYLGDNLWASVSSEVDGLRQLLDEESEDEDDEQAASWSSRTSDPVTVQPFYLNANHPPIDLRLFHPYPPLISTLCDIYFDRYDPCFKMLHQPTIRAAFTQVAADLDSLRANRAQEALMFAFYLAAISTLTDAECKQQFFDERHVLLARYKHATEVALANADFLNSQSLEALQAFTLYVLCLRVNGDGRASWALVSLAVRLGHALELPRDDYARGGARGRSRFEIEERRRLWWGIILVDGCLSEDRGTPMMTIGPGAPPPPLITHIDDADLAPDMPSTVETSDRDAWTEATFSRGCHEATITMGTLFSEGRGATPAAALELALLATKTKLEQRYLRHCRDPSKPLQWVTATVVRCAVLRLWLLIYYPRHTRRHASRVPRPTKAALLAAALAHLELGEALDRHPFAAPYRWFLTLWNPWYPIAVCLAELCTQTTGPVVERAWRLLVHADIVGKWGARAADADARKGALWAPVRKLWQRAREVRAAALVRRGADPAALAGSDDGGPEAMGRTGAPGAAKSPATTADVAAALPRAAVAEAAGVAWGADGMGWEGGGNRADGMATTDGMPDLGASWDLGAMVPAELAPVVREATTGGEAGMGMEGLDGLDGGMEGLGDGMEGLKGLEGLVGVSEESFPPGWVDWDSLLEGGGFI